MIGPHLTLLLAAQGHMTVDQEEEAGIWKELRKILGKLREKKQRKKSSPSKANGRLMEQHLLKEEVGSSKLNKVIVIELNPSKKPTTGEDKVEKPTKTPEPGSSSKPPYKDGNFKIDEPGSSSRLPCKDSNFKVDGPIARAIQSYAVTVSKPQAKKKRRANMEKVIEGHGSPRQRQVKSRLVDLKDQLFWAAKCYENVIEHMSNLDTTRLVVVIEERLNTFEKSKRNEFVIRVDSEAGATKEFALEKKISALENQLTEITKQNQETLVKYRETTQEVQQLREQGEKEARCQQETDRLQEELN